MSPPFISHRKKKKEASLEHSLGFLCHNITFVHKVFVFALQLHFERIWRYSSRERALCKVFVGLDL